MKQIHSNPVATKTSRIFYSKAQLFYTRHAQQNNKLFLYIHPMNYGRTFECNKVVSFISTKLLFYDLNSERLHITASNILCEVAQSTKHYKSLYVYVMLQKSTRTRFTLVVDRTHRNIQLLISAKTSITKPSRTLSAIIRCHSFQIQCVQVDFCISR